MPDHGGRPAPAQVGDDPRIVEAQAAGGWLVAVALLADGQRDHVHRWVGDPPQQAIGVGPREAQLADGADDPQALAVSAALGQRVQPVLRRELLDDGGAPLGHSADPPVPTGGDDRVLGERRLVGAVEGSDPQVDDPHAQLARVDRRPQRCRHGVQSGQRQPARPVAAGGRAGRSSAGGGRSAGQRAHSMTRFRRKPKSPANTKCSPVTSPRPAATARTPRLRSRAPRSWSAVRKPPPGSPRTAPRRAR